MSTKYLYDPSKSFVGRKSTEYFLPRNFNNNDETKNKEFEKEFEIFVNKFIQELQEKNANKFSTQIVKKANEDGGFDEMVIHSSKLEAWNRLEKNLRKTIINKPSAMHRYTDIFNSKSIERTISRGTFLLALNNSPIFNQGLLNIDETYRVHYKDELYKFASFILDLYKEKLSIKQDMKSIFKSLSKDFQNEYGFKDIDLNDKKTKNRLISTLENIEKHIELLTADIKELISSVKNLIFGKDTIVGIDNFHLAWEYLFTSCMKKIYGEDCVFDEDEISIKKTHGDKIQIKPDTIIIKTKENEPSTLHIFDPKYKKLDINEDITDYLLRNKEDWLKQIIYTNNFLNPEINPKEINLQVDTNIYLIYPGQSNYKRVCRIYGNNIYLIMLNILDLLKVYNDSEVNPQTGLNEICNNNPALRIPEQTNKPFILSCCIDDKSKLLTSSYNNEPKNRYNYFFNCNKVGCTHTLTKKYFCTKKIVKDNGKYSFNN